MHEEGALTEGERAELERLHAEEPTLGSQAPEGSGPDEGRVGCANSDMASELVIRLTMTR